MPEGDTIFRLAARLRPVLVGNTITAIQSTVTQIRERHLVGSSVQDVSSRGKNLLMSFSSGLTLHTHLRMNGAWHVYERGASWRMPSFTLKLALITSHHECVCFAAPVVRLLRTERLPLDPMLSALGPDLLDESFSAEEATSRLASQGERTIAEALLDQSLLAGIGNVLKSEILFLQGVHPQTKVAALSAAQLRALVEEAANVMGKAVTPGRERSFALPGRVTRRTSQSVNGQGGELWVYGREREACYRCGGEIKLTTFGKDARVTYHCPRCQPARPV